MLHYDWITNGGQVNSLTTNWHELSWSTMVQFQKIGPEIGVVF